MSELRILFFGVLVAVMLFSGIALAGDIYGDGKDMFMGFGSGTGFGSGGGFGSSLGIYGFGGSVSSMGTVSSCYGFGSGFHSETDSGPMSSGDAWSTGRTGNPDNGWHPMEIHNGESQR